MSETPLHREPEPPTRRRRSDGERSRNAILYEATQLATLEGLTGLSISRLAEAVGMSKSGLFAHFGSKEELQLETIQTASAIFNEQVIAPAAATPRTTGPVTPNSRPDLPRCHCATPPLILRLIQVG